MGRVARRSGLRRVLAEVGVRGHREATREGAERFRAALEELGTTFIKLGQLLSSRPDLLPDVYIEELGRLVDDVAPVPFADGPSPPTSATASSRASPRSRSRPPRSRRRTARC